VSRNPFPGAAPYFESDRARFFGREELSRRLEESVLGNRCITVYGPHGAGKTSLLRASVLPALVESQDVREVHVDAWPSHEDPIRRLADSLRAQLASHGDDAALSPSDAVMDAAKRAARGSSRLMVVCLDQVEQLFYVERPAAPTEAFLVCLEELLELPLRPVRVIVSLREDYLGGFLDRLRGRLRMLEQYHRVVPFTVAELTDIACRTAAAGEPPQRWEPAEIAPLMLNMRTHEQVAAVLAEVRLSYAQSFCRALFERRAAGRLGGESAIKRELRPYVERTIVDFEMDPAARDAGEAEAKK
jgi:Cdc6-like AAA superfamily ATPase